MCEHAGIYDPNDEYAVSQEMFIAREGFARFAKWQMQREDTGKLVFIVETLSAGLDFAGIKSWLSRYDDLEAAYQAARKLRDSDG